MKLITKIIHDKELLRFVLISLCAFLLVLEVINIQNDVKIISSPEFAIDQYIPDEFKEQDFNKEIESIKTYNKITKREPVIIEYNPISSAIWSLVNLQFYLFLISLLWSRKEN